MPINCVLTFIVLFLILLKFPSAKSHRGVLELSFIASELLKGKDVTVSKISSFRTQLESDVDLKTLEVQTIIKFNVIQQP